MEKYLVSVLALSLPEKNRSFCFYFVVNLLSLVIFSAVAFGNGGPVDFSNTIGSGNMMYAPYSNVKLVSEQLTITPGFSFVDVEARYLLESTQNYDEVYYAFPIDVISSQYSSSNHGVSMNEEVPYFELTLNGEPIEYEIRQSFENDIYTTSYSEDLSIHRMLYISKIDIEADETYELVVKYQFKAFFCDITTSKNFFTSFEDRFFQYKLSPAGYWGDGSVDWLNIEFDFTEVITNGGYAIDLPEGGEWLDNTRYVISEENFALLTADAIEVVYSVSEWGRSEELLALSLTSDECEITASSTLGDNYSVNNLLDGDLTTAWSEGVEGYRDQWIDIELNSYMYMGCIGIVSGYMKNPSTYEENAMAESVTIEIYGLDGEIYYQEKVLLEDPTWEALTDGSLYSKTQFLFQSGSGFEFTRVRIKFDSVYSGTKYEDLCVSELFIAGWRWE